MGEPFKYDWASRLKVKTVCIFCSSSDSISPVFLEEARQLGEILASKKLNVIYGGAQTGAMGQLAEGVLSKRGQIIGVYPSLELGHEKSHSYLTQMITVTTMAERKQVMFEKSDAFVVFPGGIGTLDEIFELIVLQALHRSSPKSSLGMHKKPVLFYNALGFWDPLLEALEVMFQQNFIAQPLDQMFEVTKDLQSIVPILQK